VDALAPPYAPSWYDRLQSLVDRRTGLGWGSWVIAGFVVALASNLLAWLTGHVPWGVVDPYINSGAAYFAITYGGMHFPMRRHAVPGPPSGLRRS
jgi:hypothetical protein